MMYFYINSAFMSFNFSFWWELKKIYLENIFWVNSTCTPLIRTQQLRTILQSNSIIVTGVDCLYGRRRVSTYFLFVHSFVLRAFFFKKNLRESALACNEVGLFSRAPPVQAITYFILILFCFEQIYDFLLTLRFLSTMLIV